MAFDNIVEPMPLLVQMSVLKKREHDLQNDLHANQAMQAMIIDLMISVAEDDDYGPH